jgi:hypothetical protein
LGGAARELARRTAAFAGRTDPVSVAWRNVSSLSSLELGQARSVFESALRDAGVRITDSATGVEARLTLSENQTEFLLVEEIRRGDDRQAWIAGWRRNPGRPFMAASLTKKLILQRADTVLDVAIAGDAMLALSPAAVSGVPLKLPRPLPRDPRGRLRITGSNFQAYLPATICTGTIAPVTADCRATDEMWVLESGSRALLLASFAADRNYFDGRITTQTGQRKTVPPFYSAAAVEDQGRTIWFFALIDGRTQVFDPAFNPIAEITGWGSDIAGVDMCGSTILATRPGDRTAPDAIQAFDRRGQPASEPLGFAGPITALWSRDGRTAVAVVRDLISGHYEAYEISVGCVE